MPVKKKAAPIAKTGKKRKAPVKKPTVRKPRQTKKVAPVQAAAQVQPTEAKFYTGPVIQKFSREQHFEFPAGYGDNRIVLMVRDPHWLYTYWEINGRWRQAAGNAQLFLRVYNTENWKFHDIELSYGAINWYIRVPAPNKTYCVDIGFFDHQGKFIAMARSNFVTTPLDRMSDIIDEEWMIPDWEKLYSLSGGFGVGRSSGELHRQPGSGWLFSLSSPMGQQGPRPFWLAANCELIVYGATEPTATVTVQGRKVKLREDGTFSCRFSLPDGEQAIPIEAVRDDGAERKKITPRVNRKTE